MKVPESTCPTCNFRSNYATCVADKNALPEAGDFSVCIECGEILVFKENLTLRAVTLDDLVSLPEELHTELERMQRAVRQLPKR